MKRLLIATLALFICATAVADDPNDYEAKASIHGNADTFDATETGSHHIVTLDSDRGNFFLSHIYVETTDLSGLIVAGIVSIGVTGPNYNDIYSGILLATTIDQVRVIGINGVVPILDEGAEIYMKFTTVSIATEHLVRVRIGGAYTVD